MEAKEPMTNNIKILKSRGSGKTVQHVTWAMNVIKLAKYKKYPHERFAAYKIYDSEVWRWVEQQPIHMWKYDDAGDGNNYLFTKEMEVLFLLKWS